MSTQIDVVRVGTQRIDHVGGRDRDGEDHPDGAPGAGDLAGSSCGGTGSHAVIDDQRCAPGQLGRGLVATKKVRPPG